MFIKILTYLAVLICVGFIMWIFNEGKDALETKDKIKFCGIGLVFSLGAAVVSSFLPLPAVWIYIISLIALFFSAWSAYILMKVKI